MMARLRSLCGGNDWRGRQRRAADLLSQAGFRGRRLLHRTRLPRLQTAARRIVHDIQFDGVSAMPLGALGFASTPRLAETLPRIVDELKDPGRPSAKNEYREPHCHCEPIYPSRVATAYPALFMWGLDEDLLDIVENALGMPAAYHGVIVRKETVDGRQHGTRLWHQDQEDHEVLRVTIYLTDVLSEDDGPFEYVPKTIGPSYRDFARNPAGIDDAAMDAVIPQWMWKSCFGAAGTVLFTGAGTVFHRGRVPKYERIAASYYYTSRAPKNPDLCKANSFQTGLSSLDVTLSSRQQACLWEYKDLLAA